MNIGVVSVRKFLRETPCQSLACESLAPAGHLSASIAHEVNQPLAGIVANAQAALRWLEKANVDEVRERLNVIVSQGFRASDIIVNLRAMFPSDVQKKALVNINKLVLSVLAPVRFDLQKYEIELQTQLDDQIPEVLGNEVQLQQVILNLVTNAIELMSLIANSRTAHKNRTEPIQYSTCVDRRHRDGH